MLGFWTTDVVYIGAPHATTEDDVYEGYYIPQGEHCRRLH